MVSLNLRCLLEFLKLVPEPVGEPAVSEAAACFAGD